MAKVRSPVFSIRSSGTVGGIQYRKTSRGNIALRYKNKPVTVSAPQAAVRACMRSLAALWRTLSGVQISVWGSYGSAFNFRWGGFAYFTFVNMPRCLAELPLLSWPPGYGARRIDLNGDSTPLQWTPWPAGTHYTTIANEGPEPDAPDITNYIYDWTTNGVQDTFTTTSIPDVGSISSITLWAYGWAYKSYGGALANKIHGNIFVGSEWQVSQDFGFTDEPEDVHEWKNIVFDGAWTQNDLDNLKIQLTFYRPMQGGGTIFSMYGLVS